MLALLRYIETGNVSAANLALQQGCVSAPIATTEPYHGTGKKILQEASGLPHAFDAAKRGASNAYNSQDKNLLNYFL